MEARGNHGITKMAAITKPLAFLVLVIQIMVMLLNVSCSEQNTTDANGKLSTVSQDGTPIPLNRNGNLAHIHHGVQKDDNKYARFVASKRKIEVRIRAINKKLRYLETLVATGDGERNINNAKEHLRTKKRYLEKFVEHMEKKMRMRNIELSKLSIEVRKKQEAGLKTNFNKPARKVKNKIQPRNSSNALNVKIGRHNVTGGLEKKQKTFKKHQQKQKPHQNDTIKEQMQTTNNKIGSKYSRDNNDTSSRGFLKEDNNIGNSKSDMAEKMKMKRLIKKEIKILKSMEGREQVRQPKEKMVRRISYLEKVLQKIEKSERKRRIEPPKIISRVMNRQKTMNKTHFMKESEKIKPKSMNNVKIGQHNVTAGLKKEQKKEIENHLEKQTPLEKDTENEQIQSENNSVRSNNTRVNNSIDTLPKSDNDTITLAAISSTQSIVNSNITDTVTTTNYIMATSTIQDEVNSTPQPNSNTTKPDTNRYKSVVKTGDVFRIFENLLTEMKNKTVSMETNNPHKQSEMVIGKKNNKIVIVKFPVEQKASTSKDDSRWDELFSSVTTTEIPSGHHNFILTKNEEFYYDDDDKNV